MDKTYSTRVLIILLFWQAILLGVYSVHTLYNIPFVNGAPLGLLLLSILTSVVGAGMWTGFEENF